MPFNFDLINVLIVLVVVLNTTYGLIVYFLKRDSATNRLFLLLTLTVTGWGLTMMAYRGFTIIEWSILSSRLLYVAAILIPFASIYFATAFPEDNYKFGRFYKYILPIPPIFLIAISLLPNYLISGVVVPLQGEKIIVFNQFWHLLYGIYIVGYFTAYSVILFKRYFISSDILKKQLSFMLFGTLVSTTTGVVTNLIMPFLGVFALNWAGQVGVIVMITFITIAVLKYQLFNVKIIATEIFTFSLWLFIFIRTFLSDNFKDQMINLGLLAFAVIFGIFLIRSVIREVEQKEKIQKLAKDLAKTNSDLASANEKLKVLDKQKTEFVSLASHQLRSPLTAIKGYSSMILEGDYGPLADKLKEAISRIFESSQKLVLVIEDFLNITRIELGRIKYDMTEWSFNTLVKNVIGEQKPNIERRGLSFSYDEDAPEYKVYADQGKVSQVISNLIDNSVKYTKWGSIAVKVSGVTDKDGKKCVRVTVKDTGVGVAPETMPHLFQKFSRAEDASKTNIIGTGLGLYVAKQIMDAHQGKIWAESEGKGKGSTFFVELALTTGVAPVPVIPPAEQDNNPTSPAIPAPVPVPQPETRHLT